MLSIFNTVDSKLQPLFSQERTDYIGSLFHRLNVINVMNDYRERLHIVFLSLTQPCLDQLILPKIKRCFLLAATGFQNKENIEW